jgi:RND family efflux transporter MFP subunit
MGDRHRNRRGALLFAVIALAPLSALGVAACKHDAAQAQAQGGGRGGRGGRGGGGAGGMAYPVDVMPVEVKKVSYVVQAPGTLDAFERVQVTARVSGVVDRVAFSEGQQVKKGDVLVVIDSERYQLAVNSAKAQVAKAEATLKDTEAAAGRREGASTEHPGLIPGEEVETYKTKVLTAKADLATANGNVKVAEVNLRDAYVRAPMEGTIQTRTVETGQYVNAGFLMATLLRADPLLLHFQVEPQDAPRLKPGMKVDFTMRETQEPYQATITLVSAAADPTTHTVGITAEVKADKKYWLRPGSFCDVTIDVGATRDKPVIPRQATRATDHGYIVYVVQGDTAAEKVVQLGMNTKDGWVEVRDGLSGGELLVVRGVESMSNGAKVTAKKVDSLDASAPEIPIVPDGGRRDGGFGREGGAGGGGSGRRGGGKPAPGKAP